MTTTGGESLLLTTSDVDVLAWKFLIDAARVSFGAMTSFAPSTTARSAAVLNLRSSPAGR
jgi:hypothetical protein